MPVPKTPLFWVVPVPKTPLFWVVPVPKTPIFWVVPVPKTPLFGCAVAHPHQYILRVPPPPPGLGTADGGGSWRRRACGSYIQVVFNGKCIRTLPNWRLVAGGGNRQVKLRAGSNVLIVNKIQPVHPC